MVRRAPLDLTYAFGDRDCSDVRGALSHEFYAAIGAR
jgi:hypothetical protein